MYLIVIVILLVPNMLQFYNVFAATPIFGPSRTVDIPNEVVSFPVETNIDKNYISYLNKNKYVNVDLYKYKANNTSSFDNLPVDILSAIYFSDGKTLNATIWLSDPIYGERHNYYVHSNLIFSMGIFSEGQEPTHVINIYPNEDGTWTKIVQEYEPVIYFAQLPLERIPTQSNRIIESIHNYTGFYEDHQRYIDLSVDLDNLGSPDSYWVGFNVYAIDENSFLLNDNVLMEHAPPKKRIMVPNWPNNIHIRAGGETTLAEMSINSTDLNVPETFKFTDANKTDGVEVQFQPSEVKVPVTGITKIKLVIKAEKDEYIGNPTFTNQTIAIQGKTIAGAIGPKFYWILPNLEIKPPLRFEEKVGDILRNSVITYIIPVVVTSVFIIWLSRYISKKRDPYWIRVKDMLTVDASVIAGVLIFLTIGASEVFSGEAIQQVGILTASIVFPFAIAAIITIIKGHVEIFGTKLMIAGFVYLMTSVVLVAFIQK